MRYSCYLDEEIDDYFCVGLRPMDDDDAIDILCAWCENSVGERNRDWGLDFDEHYSLLSWGHVFWFTSDHDRVMFRIAWCPI